MKIRLVALAILPMIFGCQFTPQLVQESKIPTEPHRFERVVLLMNAGILENRRTFGASYGERAATAVEERLKTFSVQTQYVVQSLVDIEDKEYKSAISKLAPTHVVRISAVTASRVPTVIASVEWLVEVDERDAAKAGNAYQTIYKMKYEAPLCRSLTLSGKELQKKCFNGWAESMVDVLRDKGF